MRAAVIRDSTVPGIGQFGAIQAVAPSLRWARSNVRDASEALTAFARGSNGFFK